eukprot:scaffold11919_cov96-Isochrysis_galbana.AAC.1
MLRRRVVGQVVARGGGGSRAPPLLGVKHAWGVNGSQFGVYQLEAQALTRGPGLALVDRARAAGRQVARRQALRPPAGP